MFRIHPCLSNASWKVTSPRLSLKNYLSTLMSIRYPSLPKFFSFFHSVSFFLFAKAVKLYFSPSKKSSTGLVAKIEAMMLPALLPAMILGMQSASISVWTTPIWYMPKMAPPLSKSALLPIACLISPKNSSFRLFSMPALRISWKHRWISSWKSCTSFLLLT